MKELYIPNTRLRGDKKIAELEIFAEQMQAIQAKVDFKMSARGWCYILEGMKVINKDNFDKVEKAINTCRKLGVLPIDFTAQDAKRRWQRFQSPDPEPYSYVRDKLNRYNYWADWYELDYWIDSPIYLQMLVEKIDLVGLFAPICEEYHVPLANSGGWSDINVRAEMCRRFRRAEQRGQRIVLLVCNDFDPWGLIIPDTLKKNLWDIARGTGWAPSNLKIHRFGLNFDYIEDNNLMWIDNLMTSGGRDLSSPSHPQHNLPEVQDYIHQYGVRKCEANAIIKEIDLGRQLCRDTIKSFLLDDWLDTRQDILEEKQDEVRDIIENVTIDIEGKGDLNIEEVMDLLQEKVEDYRRD